MFSHAVISVRDHFQCASKSAIFGPSLMSDRPRRSLSMFRQDCLWDALLHTSTKQAPCQQAKSPQSSGSHSSLKLAEFQSLLRRIFRLISPLTGTSWEYSLPLKVRAFKVMFNFIIIYLNLEHELVISNWTPWTVNTYCIITSAKKEKDFELLQSYHVEHKQVIDQRAMAAVLRELFYIYTCIH